VIGIGTDIVEIARVEQVWRRHGDRFVTRILSPVERQEFSAQQQPWRYLAKRFAAKEAVAKSLGTGIGIHLSWQDIHIRRSEAGAPLVQLSPRGGALALSLGGTQVLLTLSDERAYAVAFAVLLP
jgi:holo-[acyl-carrier protein] synthase